MKFRKVTIDNSVRYSPQSELTQTISTEKR